MGKPKKRRTLRADCYSEPLAFVVTPFPFIRIGGRFLEDLGFHIGDEVEIEYAVGRIMITKPDREVREEERERCLE